FPKLFLLLSETSNEPRTILTSLEKFFAAHLGMGMICLALGLVIATPTSPAISTHAMTPHPVLHPLIIPTSGVLLISSLVGYNTAKDIGTLGHIVAGVSGALGVWGTWVILFFEDSSKSKTTGANKRTSRFLFGNQAAASSIKSRWRKEHNQERR
ncbi:hypothetical protein DL93DRAFT_2053256, partial [Clavulina sp. PMI_390]